MESQILRPARESLDIKGRIAYTEGHQAWNLIRLKKEIINEFPQLKEKRSSFSYKLLFYHNYSQLEKAIRKMKRNNDALPILLWMVREKKPEPNVI